MSVDNPFTMSKEEFINWIHGSVRTEHLAYYYQPSDKVNTILLTVMNWATDRRIQTNNMLYLGYYHVAEWMKMAYQDRLMSEKQLEHMRSLGFEEMLKLVWETGQAVQNELDAPVVSKYLREHLPK